MTIKRYLPVLIMGLAIFGTGLSTDMSYADDDSDSQVQTMAVQDVVDLVKNALQEKVDIYNATAEGTERPLHVAETTKGFAYHKPESLNVYIGLTKTIGVGIYDAQNNDAALPSTGEPSTIIVDALLGSALQFKKYGPSYGSVPPHQAYESIFGVVCNVSYTDSFMSCGHIAWQQNVTDEWKTYINGIGNAWKKVKGDYPILRGDFEDSSSHPSIFNSDYKPYQYTFYSGGENAMGMFYRSGPDAEWVYFGGTQAVLDCSEYTGEAQKGFAGYVCYEGDKESKVVVPDEKAVKVPDTGVSTSETNAMLISVSVLGISVVAFVIGLLPKLHHKKLSFKK